MSFRRNLLFAAGAALMLAVPSSAQEQPVAAVQSATSAVQITAPVVTTWPSFENPALALSVIPATVPTLSSMALQPVVRAQSSDVAMMIVGGAMMIVGSIIHGDTGTIIMVGGGAIGLIGLYRYLN